MFGDGPLSFQEWATKEPHPVAVVQDAVLAFLRGRKDAVLYGGHAVNAYVSESRYTADVDLASPRPAELAQELRALLRERFQIAVRLLEERDGTGYRIFQVRKPRNRHLVDVRPIAVLPPVRRLRKVLVAAPPELIAAKVIRMVARRKSPQAFQDQADSYHLLLAFPELKKEEGPVAERLRAAQASDDVTTAWKDLIAQDIQAEDEDAKFDWSR
jgi:nucleotidyltransferase AbiEii toxin of type IV toxin-antitoxin system